MDINAFRYFRTLAQERNITRAAEKLGISQQSLSAQIKRLEDYYQMQLVVRTSPLELTYAGERFLSYCIDISSSAAMIQAEFQDIAHEEQGQINIGITAPRGYNIIPDICKKFSREYPKIEICLVETSTKEIFDNIVDEKVDFGIAISDIHSNRIVSVPLVSEKPMLFAASGLLREYCPEQYEELIQNNRPIYPVNLFSNCPFAMNTAGSRIRRQTDQLFQYNKITPKVILTSSNTLTIIRLVSLGIAAAFLNNTFLMGINQTKDIHGFEIEGISQPLDVKVYYLRNHYLSRAAKRFIEIARSMDTTEY